MEVPRLGVESELQFLAYTTATAMQNLNHVCNLHHSSQKCQILNPLSEVRDQTHSLIVPSQIHFPCAMRGIPTALFFSFRFLGLYLQHMEVPGLGVQSEL